MTDKIQNFIEDLENLSPEKAEIVQKVREIRENIDPEIWEKFIYGGIGFYIGEKLIGGVWTYTNHTSVIFSRGNELNDPEKLLEGGGKFRRHLKITKLEEIENKKVRFFLEQIVKLEK